VSVSRGWQGGQEINRVVFDPQIVTVRQMEEWLKQAGTYRQTLDAPGLQKNGQ